MASLSSPKRGQLGAPAVPVYACGGKLAAAWIKNRGAAAPYIFAIRLISV